MDTERAQAGWSLWLLWALGSTVGFGSGEVVGLLSLRAVDRAVAS
jgi:hypothetical protein